MAETVADTRRLITKPQNLNDAYGPPSNFLEIDVSNPQTVGVGRGRFTTYEIRVKVRRPVPPSPPPGARPLGPTAPSGAPAGPAAAQARVPCRRPGQPVCRRRREPGSPCSVCTGSSPLARWKVLEEEEGVGRALLASQAAHLGMPFEWKR